MQTKGICVPEYGRGYYSGKLLIDILKELGEHLDVDKLVIFSLDKAKDFYQRNGLIEEDKGTNIMVYNFTKSNENSIVSPHSTIKGKGGMRKTKKSRKPGNRKTKQKRHRK